MKNYNIEELKRVVEKNREIIIEDVIGKDSEYYEDVKVDDELLLNVFSLIFEDFLKKVSGQLMKYGKVFYEFEIKIQNLKEYCQDNGISENEFLEVAQKSIQAGRYVRGLDKIDRNIDLRKIILGG